MSPTAWILLLLVYSLILGALAGAFGPVVLLAPCLVFLPVIAWLLGSRNHSRTP